MPQINLVENPRRRRGRRSKSGRKGRRRNPELAILNPRRKGRRGRHRRRASGRRKYSVYARKNPGALRLPLIGALPINDILYVGGGFVGTKLASGFVRTQAANLLKQPTLNPIFSALANILTAFGLSKVTGMVFKSKEAEKMVFVGGLSSVAIDLVSGFIPGLHGLGAAELIPESTFEGLGYFDTGTSGLDRFEQNGSMLGDAGDEWMAKRQMAYGLPY